MEETNTNPSYEGRTYKAETIRSAMQFLNFDQVQIANLLWTIDRMEVSETDTDSKTESNEKI